MFFEFYANKMPQKTLKHRNENKSIVLLYFSVSLW
jgi:hypothetical protein